MNPDDYEPREHVLPEGEEEFIDLGGPLGGLDYLVIATVIETREPATDVETLSTKTVVSYRFSDKPQVYPTTYREGVIEYSDNALEGDPLDEWLRLYGDQVAREMAERVTDRALTAYENRER